VVVDKMEFEGMYHSPKWYGSSIPIESKAFAGMNIIKLAKLFQ
jgi:hypothetical protein